MARRQNSFVKLVTKKIKRRYNAKHLRHRKKLGPKHHMRVA